MKSSTVPGIVSVGLRVSIVPKRSSALGRVSHVPRSRIEPCRSDLTRWVGRGISENGQILTGKRPCHLDEHRAHQGRDFVHLDAAIEYEAQFVLIIEQSTLNRLVLWIGFANPIQKLDLALL